MTLGLCPRCPHVPLPLMASLGTAPRACGARDALGGRGAACLDALDRAARGFFSLSARKDQPWAVLEPGAHHPAAFPSLILLCWDVSPGSQISCSSACPSHAAQRGSAQPRSTTAQDTAFPPPPAQSQLLWSEAEQELSLQGFFWLWAAGCQSPASFFCWCSTGAARRRRREMHACKNQCESINQAKSERLKKSRGSRVMCVIERGFLYLQRPPRLPSCRGKPKLSAPLSELWLASRARCEPAVPAWVLMPCALQAALPAPAVGFIYRMPSRSSAGRAGCSDLCCPESTSSPLLSLLVFYTVLLITARISEGLQEELRLLGQLPAGPYLST